MAQYQYQCKKCEHIFEKWLSMSDRKIPESEECPNCGVIGEVLQYIGGAPIIHSGEGIVESAKVPSYFKDVLKGIKKANPGSTIKV